MKALPRILYPLSSLHFLLVDALATPPLITSPAILPRVDSDPGLIGYNLSVADTVTYSCPSSQTWVTSGSFGRCSSGGQSDFFIGTACLSNSIISSGKSTTTCAGNQAQTSCIVGTVYNYIGDHNPPIMNYQCWPMWAGGDWTAYRVLATKTPDASTSTTASATSGPVASGASPIKTSSPLSSTEPESKSNTGVIAGAVVGGIAGAAIFFFLGIVLYRRRIQRHQQDAIRMESVNSNVQGPAAGFYSQDVKYRQNGDLDPDPVELPLTGAYAQHQQLQQRPVELPVTEQPVEVEAHR